METKTLKTTIQVLANDLLNYSRMYNVMAESLKDMPVKQEINIKILQIKNDLDVIKRLINQNSSYIK